MSVSSPTPQEPPAGAPPAAAPELRDLVPLLEQRIARLIGWIERHDFRAYDPGDGNNSFLHPLTFNSVFLERLLQQAVYRSPFNLRPLLGIRPHTSTKGMGYIAWGSLRLFKATGDEAHRRRAEHCLGWLMQKEHRASGFEDFCWGNDFLFSSRGGRIPKGAPTIVWSGLIGQAFCEAWQVLGDERYLDVAASICRWITKLPREQTPTGDCLSYVAFKQSSVHNSSMLGAALLARVGAARGDVELLDIARSAMQYSCTRQLPDGAWWYGEAPKFHWIDVYHTGYNLDSLRRYQDATGDTSFERQLRDGLRYLKETFFEPDGCTKHYHDRKFPIDIQCCAQAIDTLSYFADLDPETLPLAGKVARWTLEHMQDDDGHFYYRDLGWAKARAPMLHWGQGTMLKALAHLLGRLTAAGA